jgi:hypothetical protein
MNNNKIIFYFLEVIRQAQRVSLSLVSLPQQEKPWLIQKQTKVLIL